MPTISSSRCEYGAFNVFRHITRLAMAAVTRLCLVRPPDRRVIERLRRSARWRDDPPDTPNKRAGRKAGMLRAVSLRSSALVSEPSGPMSEPVRGCSFTRPARLVRLRRLPEAQDAAWHLREAEVRDADRARRRAGELALLPAAGRIHHGPGDSVPQGLAAAYRLALDPVHAPGHRRILECGEPHGRARRAGHRTDRHSGRSVRCHRVSDGQPRRPSISGSST